MIILNFNTIDMLGIVTKFYFSLFIYCGVYKQNK